MKFKVEIEVPNNCFSSNENSPLFELFEMNDYINMALEEFQSGTGKLKGARIQDVIIIDEFENE